MISPISISWYDVNQKPTTYVPLLLILKYHTIECDKIEIHSGNYSEYYNGFQFKKVVGVGKLEHINIPSIWANMALTNTSYHRTQKYTLLGWRYCEIPDYYIQTEHINKILPIRNNNKFLDLD